MRIVPKVGFIVFGVHKDGLLDPMGTPFIDDALVDKAKQALRDAGVDLVEYESVIASKQEARECLGHFKHRDEIDAIVLFSGTWVWSAHLVAAIRDFAGDAAKASSSGRTPARRAGGPSADWSCTAA